MESAPLPLFAVDVDETVVPLDDAIGQLDSADCRLYVAAAKRRKGELLRGVAGRAFIDECDEYMMHNTIEDPQRMTRLLAPGFGG